MNDHGPSPQEEAETFGVPYTGPQCDDCGAPISERGTCADCQNLALELEAEGVWTVFLASLKYGAGDLEVFDKRLAGWKYVGADIEREQNSKGISIAKANNICLLAPGHKGCIIYSRHESGMPIISVLCGRDIKFPDWGATFSFTTPAEIILSAANAVIHQ